MQPGWPTGRSSETEPSSTATRIAHVLMTFAIEASRNERVLSPRVFVVPWVRTIAAATVRTGQASINDRGATAGFRRDRWC